MIYYMIGMLNLLESTTMTYVNPMDKTVDSLLTPFEMLDVAERMTDEVIEYVEPKPLRLWLHTVTKSNFILAQSFMKEMGLKI